YQMAGSPHTVGPVPWVMTARGPPACPAPPGTTSRKIPVSATSAHPTLISPLTRPMAKRPVFPVGLAAAVIRTTPSASTIAVLSRSVPWVP
uniref:Uncharacterized protein n=1 Tax=Callorhinchus milii TaxID=7868 RepID=A0A4W3GEV4_CALMI